MAGPTYYFLPSSLAGTTFLNCQVDGVAPSDLKFSPLTGFLCASPTTRVTQGESADVDSQTVRSIASWSATPSPPGLQVVRGNGWRTPNPLTGYLTPEPFSYSFMLGSDGRANDGLYRAQVRLFHSPSPDGTGAVEITDGIKETTATTLALTTAGYRVVTGSWTGPGVHLDNAYLFFVVGMYCTNTPTLAASAPERDLVFWRGAESSITIPTLVTIKAEISVHTTHSRQAKPPRKTVNRTVRATPRRHVGRVLTKRTEKRISPPPRRHVANLRPKRVDKSLRATHKRLATSGQWWTYFQVVRLTHRRAAPKVLKVVTKNPIRATWRSIANVRGFVNRYEPLNLGRYLWGRMGNIEPEPRLYRSNIYGEELELLRTVRSASISLNNQRDHLFEMSLSMRATDQFNPLADYVKPVIDYWNATEQTYERWPLGVYRMLSPSKAITEAATTWNFVAGSFEGIVAGKMADKGYAVLPGTKVLAKVRQILTTEFGVPASMIDFPPDNEDVGVTGYRIFDIREDTDGCYWLNIINTMLPMGGYLKLQVTADGKLRTRRISDPRSRPPDVIYGEGGDNIVDAREAVTIDVDESEFANSILVTSSDTLLPPIVARAENHHPDSPTSIENMDNRVITAHIPLPELVNASAAQAIADAELARRTGLNEALTFSSPFDPRRAAPSEVAGIWLRETSGEWAVSGRWIYQGWAASMEPMVAKMEHTLTRLGNI